MLARNGVGVSQSCEGKPFSGVFVMRWKACWLHAVLAHSEDYHPSNDTKTTLKLAAVMMAPLILIAQLLFIHFRMGH